MTDGADDTVRRVSQAWRELRRGASGAALRSHLFGDDGPELEQGQLDALEILASDPGGWRMSSFAEALRVDASTATRAITRLERLGLATRGSDESDRRIVVASATAEGDRLVNRVGRLRSIGVGILLEPFTDDEREQFAEYLERFVASIDALSAELDAPRPAPT